MVLATFTLTPLRAGSLDLQLDFLTGIGDNVLFDLTAIDAAQGFFGGGSVIVTPEPGTALLVVLGLVGLAAAHRGS